MSTPPLPQHCPTAVELDDLELLASGALRSIRAFNEPGSPVTLTLPEEIAAEARSTGAVELVDPEGLPLALATWPDGTVAPLTHAQHGPFRRLMLAPGAYRRQYAGRVVVPVSDPLTSAQVRELAGLGPLTLLALVGTGTPSLSPVALVRATLAASRLLPDAVVVTVPLAAHGDPEADHALGVEVVEVFAAGDPVHALTHATDGADPAEEDYPAEVAAILDQDQPPPDLQGLVLFFTGLSGSGKSTLARALVDRLLERGERTVTSLDGDVVRRNLSAGLTFSREDRETNIRRIGWVAAEISRHGGVAVVSPIAPYDETRRQVRAMVEDAGGAFFLVHVATPLEECERRDRKGLYAKARAGLIPEFTGISSPYEEPQDADVRVDTTGRSIDDALHDVLRGLRAEGYLDLLDDEPAPPADAPEGSPVPAVVVEGATAPAVVEEGAPAPVSRPRDPHPLHVLFVCTANICRSPSLELMARHALPDGSVSFASAGTHGFVDEPIDEVVAAALPDGIDATGFRSRRLTGGMLEEADLVLTAETAHRSFILDDHPGLFRKVFTVGQFAQAVARAPEGLGREALLAHIAAARGTADPALDVPDPYRRGPETAAECVAHLEELLRVVLPALRP